MSVPENSLTMKEQNKVNAAVLHFLCFILERRLFVPECAAGRLDPPGGRVSSGRSSVIQQLLQGLMAVETS